MNIRAVTSADHEEIGRMVHAAFLAEFGRVVEDRMVERMRALGDVVREDVAESDGALVGHIMFSRAFVGDAPVVQLGPVCAAPGLQKRGVGSALIRHGLDALRGAGETHVFLLGHRDYYPRFGFSAEAARAFDALWNGPNHMVLRLGPGGQDGGKLVVSKAFG